MSSNLFFHMDPYPVINSSISISIFDFKVIPISVEYIKPTLFIGKLNKFGFFISFLLAVSLFFYLYLILGTDGFLSFILNPRQNYRELIAERQQFFLTFYSVACLHLTLISLFSGKRFWIFICIIPLLLTGKKLYILLPFLLFFLYRTTLTLKFSAIKSFYTFDCYFNLCIGCIFIHTFIEWL